MTHDKGVMATIYFSEDQLIGWWWNNSSKFNLTKPINAREFYIAIERWAKRINQIS